VSNWLDPVNSAVWQFLTDDCWNCFMWLLKMFYSSSIDVISIWLLFVLIWFCVVSKWWWDLVNCMVWIFLLYDGLNQICIGVYLFFFLIYLIFVLHFDFMCSSVSRFEQMQTEILLMYMLKPSKFNPMVQRPWTTQTFLRWKTLVPLHSTRT
jgi:hypothetical protein